MPDLLDVEAVRADFPVLARMINGHALAYLDSANTSLKPRPVVDAMSDHYLFHNANVARAMHTLGAEATAAYEGGRATIAGFIGADAPEEIVFTKNASEALNLAAHTLGAGLGPGDEIVVSVMEHHSNLVPWQLLAQRTGAVLRWFDVTADYALDLDRARADGLINERTRVVSIAATSNVLGTVNPIASVAAWAHQVGARVVVDAAQAVPGGGLARVSDIGADLVAFTGHKMLGPTGIGVLWGRQEVLASLPPFLGGGEMIAVVEMASSTYAEPPHRFEAGTPPIAEVVGLAAACDYLDRVGREAVVNHEAAITGYALTGLATVPGLRVIGPSAVGPDGRGGAVAFTLQAADGLEIHPHDVMTMLDSRGIAVRGGHHCARPLHRRLGLTATTRLSPYIYTTRSEIDRLVEALEWTRDFFGGTR
jgi:cysteine desulfurase / selenocysteine lyase